ncbi:hypothetical protein [uncultured Desulfosarcina sp.]|uniref:hypothetical protein n=1 Tax=uncultured Desulfosarcina sp. TaxID=218289 RepID=UPI0029C64DC7|nr:hypothetical protein [uncultured Desulfosarcina sp.]
MGNLDALMAVNGQSSAEGGKTFRPGYKNDPALSKTGAKIWRPANFPDSLRKRPESAARPS